jgi:hypothetical protein
MTARVPFVSRHARDLYPAGAARPHCAGVGLIVDEPRRNFEAVDGGRLEPGEITERPLGKTFVFRDADGRRVEIESRV